MTTDVEVQYFLFCLFALFRLPWWYIFLWVGATAKLVDVGGWQSAEGPIDVSGVV